MLPSSPSRGSKGCTGCRSVNRLRIVQLEIAVDLVGRDMVQARHRAGGPPREAVRADDVGVQERFGIRKGVVDMGLGGEVDDRVGVRDQVVEQLGVGDVALDQPDVVLHGFQRLPSCWRRSSRPTR